MERADTTTLPDNVKSHLPEHLVADLVQAIGDAKLWSSKLPEQSFFYLNKEVTIRRPIDIPPGIRHGDIILADVFFDVHSMLSTLLLLKSWRLEQLAAGLANAVQSWNLSVGAAIARALLETTSAWGVESRELACKWTAVKSNRITTEDDAMKGRSQMMRASMQMCWVLEFRRFIKIIQLFEEPMYSLWSPKRRSCCIAQASSTNTRFCVMPFIQAGAQMSVFGVKPAIAWNLPSRVYSFLKTPWVGLIRKTPHKYELDPQLRGSSLRRARGQSGRC